MATFKKLMMFTSALAASATGMAVDANAQQRQAASTEDTVVVTATRREQALQDIPLAVTAVGAEQLKQTSVVSTADLMRVAPSLQVQGSNNETGGTSIRIRGVGTTGNNAGLEGAVGVFIDGVYRQRSGLAMNNLFDIQRIEVLRGPQGTLFGKNTSAGAITVQPNLPKLGDYAGMLKVGYGNFSETSFEGMANIPLGDTAAFRVAGAYETRDGYVENVVTGADSINRDRQLVRAQLLWEPNDNITWRGVIDYSSKDEDCCQAVYAIVGGATLLQNSLVPGTVSPLFPAYNSITTPGRPSIEKTNDIGYASYLTIDLGNGITLKNILAHREFESTLNFDADFGRADILFQKQDNQQLLNTAEVTLNGASEHVDWLFGAYYADEHFDNNLHTQYGAQLAAFVTAATSGAINAATAAALYPVNGGNVQALFEQNGRTWSLFTHNQIDLTQRLGAVLGARYNHEEKDGGLNRYVTLSPSCGGGPFNGQGAAPPAGVPASLRLLCPRPTYHSTTSENKLTGTAGLNYDLTEDVLLYASFSHGYKAGGINLDRDAAVTAATPTNPASGLVIGTQAQVNAGAVFNPEFSDSWEFGVRSQFFNRTLTANLTYFDTDYSDFQLNTFNGLGFVIANAGSVNSHGFELEGNWHAGEGLNFTYGVTQTVAKYGDDPLLKLSPPAPAAPLPADPALAGLTLTSSPKWNVSAGVHYDHALFSDSIKGFFDLSGVYRTHINTGSDLNPSKVQPELTLINGRVGIFSDTEHGWELALWGTNLTDEHYQSQRFDTVFQNGTESDFVGAPRMYGVTFRKDF